MPLVDLGNTGLKVSKLGFGTVYLGAPSFKITPEQGGRMLAESYKLGINFWDTADDYGSHPHVASALKYVPREDIVICTKTSAKSGKDAKESLKQSLKELGTDHIDIFLLHDVAYSWIDQCHHTLNELIDVERTGIVKAIGVSTHSVAVVDEAAEFEELDVMIAICCNAEQNLIAEFPEQIPLEDGSIKEMFRAIERAHDNGKAIVAMKVLGKGAPPLVERYQSAIKDIAKLSFVDAMVVGMRNMDEVRKNVNAIVLG